MDAAHRLWCSSARRCGLCSRPRRRTPTTSSGTAGWSTRGNTCLFLKANACGGGGNERRSTYARCCFRVRSPQAPSSLLSAQLPALAHGRPSEPHWPPHITWPGLQEAAHRGAKPVRLAPLCPTATSPGPSPSQPPAPRTYSTWPRRVHPRSLSPHRRLSSEGCSVHPHSQTGVDRLGTDGRGDGQTCVGTCAHLTAGIMVRKDA